MKRIADDTSPSYDVAQLASLFTVCAAALDGAEEYADHIKDGIHTDVKHVLEWGAVLAAEIAGDVERLEVVVEKFAVEVTS